ncbi:EAL domain-containing protein [Granulosicoccus antarcticus]|uniref:EAL domain-containing protein n=1 Tax=Granulosicoccus antarcticus TaxID=437505 RepID=UPI000B5A36E7|nr:EAL domain-containing protein [Granulosicoccus antarcticus]
MSILLPDELERLNALRALDVLDSHTDDDEFSGLVEAAALACGVTTAVIALLDQNRHWLKATTGLAAIDMSDVTETPLAGSFSAHTIAGSDVFEVADASMDARFLDNPLVTGKTRLRFYAGAPLRLSSGHQVGALCVLDREPQQLDDGQRQMLRHLAVTTAKMLETRETIRTLAITTANFRALGECTPMGLFRTDTSGACTFANDLWEKIFGMSRTDAYGHGWSRTLHPDDRQHIFDEWQRCAQQKLNFDMEFRVLHDNGTVLHVHALTRPMIGETGEWLGHIGSVCDISAQRKQSQALEHNRQLLGETGSLADVGGWELDIVADKMQWTEQTFRIFGLSSTEAPSINDAINYYAPEARAVMHDAIAHAINEGRSWDLELPFRRANGESIWVRAVGRTEFSNGKAVRLFGAIQDATQQVTQRRALENAHKRISIATNSAKIGVWEWEVDTDTLLWTAQTYALFGQDLSAAPLNYASWAQCVHPEDLPIAEQHLKLAIEDTGRADAEYRVIWPDGSIHHLRSSGHVTRDEQGRALKLLGVHWDVTDVRQLTAELAEQHELLRVTLQSIGDAVITTNADALVTWMNPAAEGLTGWLSSEAEGRPLDQVFHIMREDTRQAIESPVDNCLALNKVVGLANHTMLISRDGHEISIEDSAAPIHGQHGTTLGAVLVFHDVTEKRRLAREMMHRATHDALTGLINRSEFEVRLQYTLDRAHEDNCLSALMYIDLDQFKLVNDACGHTAGDELLLQMSKLLTATIRDTDTAARLGGDEFGVILHDCDDEQALHMAQAICDRMDEFRFTHDGQRFRIGTSIGLVPMDNRWPDKQALLQAADISCYAAKEAGRNRVHLWFDTDKLMQERQGDMQWAARLEQALDENRFELHLQRIEPLFQTCGLHAEVLIRLRDVDGSLVLPGQFLPAAERYHLATRIDRYVLRSAIDLLSSSACASTRESSPTMLFINLSGQSIGDRVFHHQAIDMLTSAGATICQTICLEITETAAVTNIADATKFIEQLRALGVRIALDDFGAGASSFGYLKSLQVDLLKIDGQYITGLIDDPLNDAAVRSFVEVANIMGLKTVAEYVGSPAILERVRAIGIDFAQGFLLHRPEPANDVLTNIERVLTTCSKPS